MSFRDVSPIFRWGFNLKESKYIIPLLQNNVITKNSAIATGPYGWTNKNLRAPSQQTVRTHSKSTLARGQFPKKTAYQSVFHNSRNINPKVQTIQKSLKASQKIQLQQKGSTSVENENIKDSKFIPIKEKELHEDGRPSLHCPPEPEPTSKPLLKNESNAAILKMLHAGKIQQHKLEDLIGDNEKAVEVRRLYFSSKVKNGTYNKGNNVMSELPYEHFDYDQVHGVCAENVIGYVPIPVGIVGPVKINGKDVHVPMATTEGCLIASTQRGAKALSIKGITTAVTKDGMTRGPVLQLENVYAAQKFVKWCNEKDTLKALKKQFGKTTGFGKLKEVKTAIAGRKVFVRFKCFTGDAMGMNMISKGVTQCLKYIQEKFPKLQILAVSGNFCIDKKASAINWIEGRGKSVVCDAIVPKEAVKSILKTNVDQLVELNVAKNLIGSAMAGSVGGFNAHASNIVTAIYIACGQDPAQNVESSNCMTLMEKTSNGDLYISCTMPSIEVGTIGGGTGLDAQKSCLNIVGVQGPNKDKPGKNARKLAQVVAASVMCGELSLMSALASGDLVTAHMKFNRKK